MLLYIKYIVIWLLFMGLIAGVTLVVPKISARVEKTVKAKKQAMAEQNEEASCTTTNENQ